MPSDDLDQCKTACIQSVRTCRAILFNTNGCYLYAEFGEPVKTKKAPVKDTNFGIYSQYFCHGEMPQNETKNRVGYENLDKNELLSLITQKDRDIKTIIEVVKKKDETIQVLQERATNRLQNTMQDL